MNPLTEHEIRTSFVNASRGEAARATLPDLGAVRWDRLDYLGWRDRKAPLAAYAVVEVDDGPVGLLLRSGDPRTGRPRRKAVCAWCTDVTTPDDVSLYVARRGGASGRKGDTIGTLICTDFSCSRNVRRPPTRAEVGTALDPAELVEQRVAALRERVVRFATEVARTR